MQAAVAKRSVREGLGSRIFLGITALFLLTDMYLIFAYVPTEQVMGVVQRLFYFHVPSALTGFVAFGVAAVTSIAYLVRRSPRWDRIAYSAVEVGTVMFTAAIVTGAMWAKPVWNTWWVWDANGTLAFMMWIVFISYLIVRAYAPSPEMGRRWGAVLALVGLGLAPIMHMAANWWGGLHPENVIGPTAPDDALESSMAMTLGFSLLSFVLLFAYLVTQRVRQRGLEDEIEELRRELS